MSSTELVIERSRNRFPRLPVRICAPRAPKKSASLSLSKSSPGYDDMTKRHASSCQQPHNIQGAAQRRQAVIGLMAPPAVIGIKARAVSASSVSDLLRLSSW